MKTLISLTLFLSLMTGFYFNPVDWLASSFVKTTSNLTVDFNTQNEGNTSFAFASQVFIRDTFVVEGNASVSPDTLYFVVERTDDATAFTIDYVTCDSSATVGDQDYEHTSGSIQFIASPGVFTDTIKVPVLADDKTELDEKMQIFLTRIINNTGMTCFSDSIGIGTIINNDTSYLSIRDTFMTEGDGGTDSLNFVIDMTGELDTMFNFSFITMDSSAIITSDYFFQTGIHTGSGSGTGNVFLGIDTITIGINGDRKVETDEHLKVLLSNINAGGRPLLFMNNDSLAVGTIFNDDTTLLSIYDATIIEGDVGTDTLKFVVSVDNPVDSLAIVYMTMDSIASATTDTDYVAIIMDTIYMHCLTTDTIKIAVKGDKTVELDEIFKIKLLEILPGNRVVSFLDSIAIGTIINDDFDPTIIDPCDCLNNESTSGANDGQFAETVRVTSQIGETWYVASVSGLYQKPFGIFPPAKGGNPYSLTTFLTGITGQHLTETNLGNGLSEYSLQGIHVDNLGYIIYVTNGMDILTIGNTCHYEKACGADQTIVIPFLSRVSGEAKIDDCNANNLFINDGHHLYQDTASRYNEMTICPNLTGQILTVSFSAFDLTAGDTLFVYDGKNTTSNLIAKGSGNSISLFNGGWVTSNCDPNINPSGCLTFVFKTNGDNNKGAGWEAKVNCALEGVTTINPVNDIYASASCDSLKTAINLRIPTINRSSSDCTLTNDSIIVTYCDIRDTFKAGQLTYPVFAFGTYTVNYKLVADTTIVASNRIHVSIPSLTCNDTVITTIGQGCVTRIEPDDILEGPCDTSGASMNLFYTVIVHTDSGLVVGTAPNYPLLDASKGGNVRCNAFYKVTIVRTLQETTSGCAQTVIDSCFGVVKLVDGIKPVFVEIKDDTIFGCYDNSFSPELLTPPTVIDNCEIDKLIPSIPENLTGGCEGSKKIIVTWTAYDLCGNISVATQNVVFKRPTTLVIPSDTIVNCGAATEPDSIGWPKIDSNGDNIGNQIITDKKAYCNFNLKYTDQLIPGTCGNNGNILRIFTLLDDCVDINSAIFVDTQYILIRDTIAPIVNCPIANTVGSQSNPYLFRTAYNSCMGFPGTITPPTGTDNCMANLSNRIVGVYSLKDNILVASSLSTTSPLEVGKYRVAYELSDACGNTSDICNVYFNIVDQTIPTAICTDELVISLASNNLVITPQDINEGTFDACGIDTMLIRRSICGNPNEYPVDTNFYVASKFATFNDANAWSSSIEIGCCDMNSSIKVQLLVFDKGGNYNKCWLTILLENQPQSVCGNLPDSEGFCDDYNTSQIGASTDANGNRTFDENEWQPIDNSLLDIINAQFGNPACNSNAVCTNTSIEQEYQLIKESCGIQTMKRRFRTKSVDSQTNYTWYSQNIIVKYRPGWSFTFPPDTTLQCGATDVGNIPEMPLIINRGSCDQIAWEVKDEIFETDDGSCFKILRQWYIINACQHSNVQQPFKLPRDQTDGLVTNNSNRTFTTNDVIQGTPLNTLGYFSYTQLIIVMDNEAPIITIADVDTCIVGVGDAAPFNQADQTPGAAPFECDTLRLFSATGMDCTTNNLLDFRYEIFDGAVRIAFGVGSSVYQIVQPNKTYRVRFYASDNCGNSGFADRTFTFSDCRKPTVFCEGINISLDNNQLARINAKDINAKSYDNCTNSINLDLRIWHSSLGVNSPINLAEVLALPTFITLDCDNRGNSLAYLYVIDEAQNYGLCGADVIIGDNLGVCPVLRPTISGSIQTVTGDMVEQVQVLITGTVDMPEMITTDVHGTFRYEVESGANYTIRPKKDRNPLNGVSTYDLILIQQHILNIRPFDSPYKYIAADINQSETISAYDMVLLRQMILSILTDFPNNQSWKFVDMTYSMEVPNPFAGNVQEYHSISDIKSNIAVNFMAVKVGDINGNAKPNSLLSSEERNFNGTLDLLITDQKVEAGKDYTLDFSINNLDQILGYQFTLQFDGLTFENWDGGLIDKNYFGYSLVERGFLTASWNKKEDSKLSEKEILFKLKFTANQDGLLSEMLTINSKITSAEAYNMEAELLNVQLVFEEAVLTGKTFELFQNRPNPFREQTRISFYLPEDSKTTLTILDITGKVVKTITSNYKKGEHAIILKRNELLASGMLYYQLESSAGKMTKTMLVLD